MTSAPSRRARAIPTSVLPEPVAPTRQGTGRAGAVTGPTVAPRPRRGRAGPPPCRGTVGPCAPGGRRERAAGPVGSRGRPPRGARRRGLGPRDRPLARGRGVPGDRGRGGRRGAQDDARARAPALDGDRRRGAPRGRGTRPRR